MGGGPADPRREFKMFGLAAAAMKELIIMAQMNEPLWITSVDGSGPVLNEDEYLRAFPNRFGSKPTLIKHEASRENAVVMMKRDNLIEILMDVKKWSTVFCGMVTNPKTLEIISEGEEESYNGALQVMIAEHQVPVPHVPTRKSQFLRYCKKHEDGTWVVVDVSLESPTPMSRSYRRPSGCLIQEMTNDCSKVTWVEHVLVEEFDIAVDDLYKQLLSSGIIFAAKHWVATLDRHSERLASVLMITTNINPPATVVAEILSTEDWRKNLLKLAERMMVGFCGGVCSTITPNGHFFVINDVKLTLQKSVGDPGKPSGQLLSAATFFHIPVQPKKVYDFLRDKNSRMEWDILSNGASVEEMARIAFGRGTSNGMSLLRLNHSDSSQTNILVLEETSSDQTSSFVIYASVDMAKMMNVVRDGGDPYKMPLLPSGFAIFPDGSSGGSDRGGSLVTIGFQLLIGSLSLSPEYCMAAIAAVKHLTELTVGKIFEGFSLSREDE